ncbi:MAG: hypothetical protein ACE5E5_00065 [Phycisphaerae bacterium]
MPDFSARLEQVHQFFVQHLPPEALANMVPVAVLVLIAGITISVLGAKLARVALMLGFAAVGIIGGKHFAEISGYSLPLCVIAGCGMVAAIGHLTFRLWVGAAVGAVLTVLALGVFSYDKLIPQINEYEQARLVAVQGDGDGFVIPTAQQKASYIAQKPAELVREFWTFATGKDPSIENRALSVGLAAMVIGLFLGVVAVRWALVLATSLAGTILVASGVCALLAEFLPSSYRALVGSSLAGGITLGGFFLTSVLLQGLLTRKPLADSRSSDSND